MSITLTAREEVFPIRGVFRISRGARTESRAAVATISDGAFTGRGECMPYARYGETVQSVLGEIEHAGEALKKESRFRHPRDSTKKQSLGSVFFCLFFIQQFRRFVSSPG